MAWLKVAGWQLPHLRGKQVFLAPCLGGYGAGLINHGEQYPVLLPTLIPTPYSSPCSSDPAWDSSCRVGNCPELRQPPTWPSHTQQEGDPPHLPSWACPVPHCYLLPLLLPDSSHTARSRFPLVLPALFLPYTHPLEHSLQFSAFMSHHPQSLASQTSHSAEAKGFPTISLSPSGTWRQVMALSVDGFLHFCVLLFLLNSYCRAQRTQRKHAEDCAKHMYAWVEN